MGSEEEILRTGDPEEPELNLFDNIGSLREAAPIRGIEVNYYVVCPRKCWLFVHGLEQEAGSELVALGRLLHEASFQRQTQRNVDIEGFVRMDFTTEGIVHEVKHGPSQHRAHMLQVAYYLWLLRQRGVETQGVLHYPRQRRREVIRLTPELEEELQEVLIRIKEIRKMPCPPRIPRRMSVCRSCAYDEFCWGEDWDEPEEG